MFNTAMLTNLLPLVGLIVFCTTLDQNNYTVMLPFLNEEHIINAIIKTQLYATFGVLFTLPLMLVQLRNALALRFPEPYQNFVIYSWVLLCATMFFNMIPTLSSAFQKFSYFHPLQKGIFTDIVFESGLIKIQAILVATQIKTSLSLLKKNGASAYKEALVADPQLEDQLFALLEQQNLTAANTLLLKAQNYIAPPVVVPSLWQNLANGTYNTAANIGDWVYNNPGNILLTVVFVCCVVGGVVVLNDFVGSFSKSAAQRANELQRVQLEKDGFELLQSVTKSVDKLARNTHEKTAALTTNINQATVNQNTTNDLVLETAGILTSVVDRCNGLQEAVTTIVPAVNELQDSVNMMTSNHGTLQVELIKHTTTLKERCDILYQQSAVLQTNIATVSAANAADLGTIIATQQTVAAELQQQLTNGLSVVSAQYANDATDTLTNLEVLRNQVSVNQAAINGLQAAFQHVTEMVQSVLEVDLVEMNKNMNDLNQQLTVLKAPKPSGYALGLPNVGNVVNIGSRVISRLVSPGGGKTPGPTSLSPDPASKLASPAAIDDSV